MRMRTANPLQEIHGLPMTCIEWIVPTTTDPATLHTRIEGAIGAGAPKLFHRGDGQVAGSVSTLLAPSGAARYVCVLLHRAACTNNPCPHAPGGGITVSAAPALPANALALIGAAIGEDPARVLTGGAGDTAILQALGFRPADPATGFPGDAPFRA